MKFLNKVIAFFKHYVFKVGKVNKVKSFQDLYQKSLFYANSKIKYVIVTYFHSFIPYATKHYNIQLDILEQKNSYRAKWKYPDMLDLAVDYFKRNRNRLFQWWCMNNENALTSDDEFQVLRDIYGFNDAFKTICNKKFYIDVCPDTNYVYGVNVIDNSGNINNELISLMN